MADIEKLYTKAKEAFDRKNYEYAVNLFRQILKLDPDNQDSRRALRASCIKFVESKGKAPSKIAAMMMRAKVQMTMRKPEKAIEICEEHLTKDPNDTWVRAKMGAALLEAGHAAGAVTELEAVFAMDQENVDMVRNLGLAYAQTRQIQKAQEMFTLVKRLNPSDREVDRHLKDMAARGTIESAHLEDAESSRDIMKDKDLVASYEKQSKLVKSDEEIQADIDELVAEIAEEEDVRKKGQKLKKLGDLQVRIGDLAGAMKTLKQAQEVDPMDATIRAQIGDVQIREQVEKADALAAAGKHAEEKELRKKILVFQVQEALRRVKDHPTDLGLKFDLGVLYLKARKLKEAIGQFQMTVRDPKRRLPSLLYLGQAFLSGKKYDMAVAQFKKALEDPNLREGSEMRKNLRYQLASSYEQKGDVESALLEYNAIMEVDINFKDVADKVDELQS